MGQCGPRRRRLARDRHRWFVERTCRCLCQWSVSLGHRLCGTGWPRHTGLREEGGEAMVVIGSLALFGKIAIRLDAVLEAV